MIAFDSNLLGLSASVGIQASLTYRFDQGLYLLLVFVERVYRLLLLSLYFSYTKVPRFNILVRFKFLNFRFVDHLTIAHHVHFICNLNR